MNKIVNWTIGSFFRTIGRIIAYIGIGIVITYILSNSNINWGGITELFFDKVSASEVYDSYRWIPNYYSDLNLTQARADDGLWSYFDEQTTTSFNSSYSYNFNYFNQVDLSAFQDGTVQFEYELSLPQIYTTATSTIYGSDYCNRWDWLTVDSYNNVIKWGCDRIGESQDSLVSDREYIYPRYSIKAYLMVGTDNSSVPCQVDQNINRIICPLSLYTHDVHGLAVYSKVFYNSSTNSTYRFRFGKQMLVYRNSETTINNSINQQTQQQQQQHEEMMDDNTTQAESEATDFFEDFDAPDIGGLGAIITAPLNTIRSLLNSSCTNLVLPLPFVNQNLTLPCMNTIYTQHFGAFFTIYQTIILAIIAYRCIRSIFFDIHGFTNPNDDRIEVMDL